MRHALYKQQTTVKPVDRYFRYLSPTARIEAEHQLRRERKSAFHSSPSRESLASTTTFMTSATNPQPNASDRGTPQPAVPEMPPPPPPITLPSLIDDFFNVTILDFDHLPSRVHLGTLYHEKGDLALAEHWLERACKGSKGRGAGGGKGGISTCYGGSTAVWGWEGWRWLGRVLRESGRLVQAKECVYFAVSVEKASSVRGFECLRRSVEKAA